MQASVCNQPTRLTLSRVHLGRRSFFFVQAVGGEGELLRCAEKCAKHGKAEGELKGAVECG